MRDWCDCFHPLYLDVPEARGVLDPCDLTSSGKDENKLPSPYKEVFKCAKLVLNSFQFFLYLGPDKDCVDNVITQLDANDKLCQCEVPCHTTEYETSYSLSRFPPKNYEV